MLMQIGEEDLYKSNLFYYINRTYGVENFDKHVRITASSQYPGSEANRESIPSILEYSSGRWVSDNFSNSYFTIEFLQGYFDFQSYVLKWSSNNRYNYRWILQGFDGSEWKTIDSRNDPNICTNKSSKICLIDTVKLFVVQSPGKVTKIRLTADGLDSFSDNILSLTQILVFGHYRINPSNNVKCDFSTFVLLFTLAIT